MKLMKTLKALVALSLLVTGAEFALAQETPAAPAPSGYEKIELPASVAILPKPPALLPGAPQAQTKEHQLKTKEWRDKSRENKAKRDAAKAASEAMVHGGTKDKSMENYFALIHFPMMTQSFGTIQRDRRYVVDELSKADPSVRPELLKLAADWAKKLAEGNYAPATRVNAALLMGELNDADAKAPAPPVPHRAALKYLVSLLDNPAIPAEVKGAALVGITRHVEIDAIAAVEKLPANQRIPQADLDAVVDKMIAIVTAKEAPADVEKSVFTFMQRRAAGLLGAYGQVGANNKVYETLVGVVGSDVAPLWVRYDAALALGRLSYTETKVDTVKAGKALGAYVAYAANDELETLKKNAEPGTGGGVGGMGGVGGPPGGIGGGASGGEGKGGGPPGGAAGGPPRGMGGPPRGMGGPPGGIGGVGGGPGGIGGVGGAGGIGGMGGGGQLGTYYAENQVMPMVRRLMATINAAQIGLDGANGRSNPGIRKPKQDTSLDLIAEKIDGMKSLLVKLQKNEGDQADVMRDFRLAILAMESAAGVKKKSGAETAKASAPKVPPAGTTGGE